MDSNADFNITAILPLCQTYNQYSDPQIGTQNCLSFHVRDWISGSMTHSSRNSRSLSVRSYSKAHAISRPRKCSQESHLRAHKWKMIDGKRIDRKMITYRRPRPKSDAARQAVGMETAAKEGNWSTATAPATRSGRPAHKFCHKYHHRTQNLNLCKSGIKTITTERFPKGNPDKP